MANMTAEERLQALLEGRYFILENPSGSWIWKMPAVQHLMAQAGVYEVHLHNCAFGGKRRKRTMLLTNVPELGRYCAKLREAVGGAGSV